MTAITPRQPSSDSTSGPWELARLDLDAYLARTGCTGVAATDAATLRHLHRAHAATIPFENLDIVLGRGVELELDAIQAKLVRRARGGYCFEHNLLFAAVLERLGFEVARLAARVRPSGTGPRTHMLLRVVADGSPWLADVGFGASLVEPLALEARETTQGAWTYRLTRSEADRWLLSSVEPGGASEMYEFTDEPQRPIDYAVANHFTATHPHSPFVGRPVVLRTEPEVKYALRGRVLTTTRPNGSVEARDVALDELLDVLAEPFGIGLEADEAKRLRQLTA